ncbi:MAG: ATP-grasp domain-containing protein, partial [Armatimonadetes bacterium]|nr:ATP-grasp domain-containing protein [Armatimonadota bacterium]
MVDVDPNDGRAVAEASESLALDLVVIGPERPLLAGVADTLRREGFPVYGPSAHCAQIEGSKAFSKALMSETGIPTPRYETFDDFRSAKAYIASVRWPVVVKASGEALGKGAIVCETADDAIDAAESMLVTGDLGEAGRTIVVEERLTGPELSLMAICSGSNYRMLPPARDYKAAFGGGRGPNTGGMGAVSPVDVDDLDRLGETFVRPVLDKFVNEGNPYCGTLYPG